MRWHLIHKQKWIKLNRLDKDKIQWIKDAIQLTSFSAWVNRWCIHFSTATFVSTELCTKYCSSTFITESKSKYWKAFSFSLCAEISSNMLLFTDCAHFFISGIVGVVLKWEESAHYAATRCCLPFHLTSSSYARHGRIAVNMPLANCSICGPESSTNSRIQSIAVSCMTVFVDWAWLIKILHISGMRVPAGSFFIAFRNSDKSVSQLHQNGTMPGPRAIKPQFNRERVWADNDKMKTYVVWISTLLSSSIWNRPSNISGK